MTDKLPDYIAEARKTPYIIHNGIELTEYGEGYCCARMKIEEHHKNLHGTVHGGSIFSLADTVAGYTAMTDGTVISTLNATINYFHAVSDSEYLYCKGEIVKSGKTITVVRTVFYDDNEKIVGDASFSCFNLRKR